MLTGGGRVWYHTDMYISKTLVAAALCAAGCAAEAALRTAAPFGDGMVLQRGMKVPVWGGADAGQEVVVTFAGQRKCAKADAAGAWRVDLEPLEACAEGRDLVIACGAETATIRDVLVGEVWFASGQSNMEQSILSGHTRYRDGNGILMTALARRPGIRFTSMPQVNVPKPALDRKIAWHDFSAKSFRDESIRVGICFDTKGLLSAVAFYYALSIHDAASPSRSWTPAGAAPRSSLGMPTVRAACGTAWWRPSRRWPTAASSGTRVAPTPMTAGLTTRNCATCTTRGQRRSKIPRSSSTS